MLSGIDNWVYNQFILANLLLEFFSYSFSKRYATFFRVGGSINFLSQWLESHDFRTKYNYTLKLQHTYVVEWEIVDIKAQVKLALWTYIIIKHRSNDITIKWKLVSVIGIELKLLQINIKFSPKTSGITLLPFSIVLLVFLKFRLRERVKKCRICRTT